MKKEKSVEDIIAEFSKIALDLSLGYVKVLAEGKTDLEAFKHLNEVKKHLNFAKITQGNESESKRSTYV